jgi:hypothetical protein
VGGLSANTDAEPATHDRRETVDQSKPHFRQGSPERDWLASFIRHRLPITSGGAFWGARSGIGLREAARAEQERLEMPHGPFPLRHGPVVVHGLPGVGCGGVTGGVVAEERAWG